jgi:hypothetical protein
MQMKQLELEGTWEEIQEHANELAGKRVHLRVVPDRQRSNGQLSERNQRMLENYERLLETPLSQEDIDILDGFAEFRKQHPFSLRQLSDDK